MSESDEQLEQEIAELKTSFRIDDQTVLQMSQLVESYTTKLNSVNDQQLKFDAEQQQQMEYSEQILNTVQQILDKLHQHLIDTNPDGENLKQQQNLINNLKCEYDEIKYNYSELMKAFYIAVIKMQEYESKFDQFNEIVEANTDQKQQLTNKIAILEKQNIDQLETIIQLQSAITSQNNSPTQTLDQQEQFVVSMVNLSKLAKDQAHVHQNTELEQYQQIKQEHEQMKAEYQQLNAMFTLQADSLNSQLEQQQEYVEALTKQIEQQKQKLHEQQEQILLHQYNSEQYTKFCQQPISQSKIEKLINILQNLKNETTAEEIMQQLQQK